MKIKRSFRNVFIFASAIAVSGVLALAVDATHSWGGYHWARTANPVTLEFGDNVSSSWDAYLAEASADWDVPHTSVLDTKVAGGNTNATKGRNTPKNCVPTAGRVEVCSTKYGNTGWLGIAQIWVSGGEHITQGTMKVNDTYFTTSKYNKPSWKRLVMCQELGHTFGLDHQDEAFDNTNLGSCMDYTSDPDGSALGQLSNEHPNTHDYAMLENIYAHLDLTNTSGQTVSGTGRGAEPSTDNSDPGSWGRAIRTSSDGRPSLYVRENGGVKVFTFVVWAD